MKIFDWCDVHLRRIFCFKYNIRALFTSLSNLFSREGHDQVLTRKQYVTTGTIIISYTVAAARVVIDCLILIYNLKFLYIYIISWSVQICSEFDPIKHPNTQIFIRCCVVYKCFVILYVELQVLLNLDRRFPEPNNMHSVFPFFKLMINSLRLSSNHFDICERSSVNLCSIILTSLYILIIIQNCIICIVSILQGFKARCTQLKCRRNKSGPKTDPWGTSRKTGLIIEVQLPS